MKGYPAFAFVMIFFLSSFVCKAQEQSYQGVWRGELISGDTLSIPFIFDWNYKSGSSQLTIHNASERIVLTEAQLRGDSVLFKFPVFATELIFKATPSKLTGYWHNVYRSKNNKIKFTAVFGNVNRFKPLPHASINVSGNWKTIFSNGTANSSLAIAQLVQNGDTLTGTFLTSSGDYRYLEGTVQGSKLFLSCFDGSHAFLFTAEKDATGMLKGWFYSGNHHAEPWIAYKDAHFTLPNPDSLTYMKPGVKELNFEFPDLNGNPVKLSDPRFQHKVKVIQIMGSWCPNCMDESRYLVSLYNKYRDDGLEPIALAFERGTDKAKELQNLKRAVLQLNIRYTVLHAGSSAKGEAEKALPQLNNISSFPTTIVLDKNNNVRLIHTGYSGPATGKNYTKYTERFEALIEALLKETE